MKNEKYKRVITWKKKPEKCAVILGIVSVIIATLMLGVLTEDTNCEEKISNRGIVILSLIFTLMIIWGYKFISKYSGKGKKIYYKKR